VSAAATKQLTDECSAQFCFWDFGRKGPQFKAFITDKNQSAVEPEKIKLFIDGLPIRAAIDDKVESKIINLLGIGGELKFATDYAKYATPLDGAGQALFQLKTCGQEAEVLPGRRQ
jgi:hypothetical protein